MSLDPNIRYFGGAVYHNTVLSSEKMKDQYFMLQNSEFVMLKKIIKNYKKIVLVVDKFNKVQINPFYSSLFS